MDENANIRLTTEEGKAPETVKPWPGEEPEIRVLEDQDAKPSSGRTGRGGRFGA